jgi:ADP-ribosylglycohydrolase
MLNPRDVYVSPINAYFRLVNDGIPARDVGRGNMQANGTAMCIAPLGAINACAPFQAAYDTFEVGSLLHSGLAREAGAAVAAAVAEAFKTTATPDSILNAATAYLTPRSGAAETLQPMFDLARAVDAPGAFTVEFYEQFVTPAPYRPLQTELVPEGYVETVDPLETVGAALGLFYVCGGDPEQTLVETANFGHDCDSLGAINGSVAGAFAGASAIPEKWRNLVDEVNSADHRQVAVDMYRALLNHKANLQAQLTALETLLQN